ncbi:MAG: tyrosine--tRNA ligase [Elusimicrobiota bacterium]
MDAIERLKRGCVELISEVDLRQKLASGRPLRVKLGVDPTTPDLHLGHTVVLHKLRAFQDLGHTAVLIIGDFTARIGDPSGRDATRPTVTQETVDANARTYQEQAFKVLDPDKTEVLRNSDWLDPFMKTDRLPKTLQRYTVQQLLAREDFQNRIKSENPITLLELLYPLLQGYDSIAVKADVELGGNDQLFNLLMGRQMQKDEGQPPQVVLTMPLLVGLDGAKKMSKTYGNAIALNDPPRDMFGQVMKISDEAMRTYYELLTLEDMEAVRSGHPMGAKKRLAEIITARFHGEEAAEAERTFFDETFSNRKAPEDVAEHPVLAEDRGRPWSVYLVKIGAVKSRKEAQRLLAQGAVHADEDRVAGDAPMEDFFAKKGPAAKVISLKVGKHRFFKLRRD